MGVIVIVIVILNFNSNSNSNRLHLKCNGPRPVARRGYVYKTVADLIKADPIPSIVYVGKECTTTRKKSRGEIIKKGSIIFIRGAVTGKSRFGKVRMLVCIRMDTGRHGKEALSKGKVQGKLQHSRARTCYSFHCLYY